MTDQSPPLSDDGKQVVTALIAEVARADLGAHVVAAERRGGETVTASHQRPVGDGGHRMPFQPQPGKPTKLGVRYRHFQHCVLGQLEPARRVAGEIHHQRQYVIGGAVTRWLPAHLHHPLGKRDLTWISADGAVCGAVAGVANQLRIPNADTLFFGLSLREDGHCSPDAPAIGCILKMSDTRLEYFFGAAGGARIEKTQAFPKQAPNAACVVAPGQPRHTLECARMQRVS